MLLETLLVRPAVAADHADAGLQRVPVDPHPLDGTGRRPLPARDLRAFQCGAGGAGRGEQPLSLAEHDLGVRAHVDQELHLVAAVRSLGEDGRRGVGPDVARDAGQHVEAGAAAAHADVRGPGVDGQVGGEREGCRPQRRRVDAEQEVVHDRVADRDQVQHVVALDARLVCQPPDELVDRRLHGVGQLDPPLRVHHHVRDPAHQVLAESDLRVHRPRGGEHLAGAELAEVAGDRRRPDVDRDAVGDVHEPRPDRDQVVAAVDGDRDRVPAGGQRGLEVDEHPCVDREAVEGPLHGERVEQQAQVAAALPERRRVDLDVVEADDRVDDEAGQVHGLADDRPVDLALGRDVDHDVAEDLCGAAQPRARDQRPAAVVVPLRRSGRGEVVGGGRDGVLGEGAEGRLHLAPAADAPAAADRVQVDAQLPGRIEHGRAGAHGATSTGRHEDGDGGAARLVVHGRCPPRSWCLVTTAPPRCRPPPDPNRRRRSAFAVARWGTQRRAERPPLGPPRAGRR